MKPPHRTLLSRERIAMLRLGILCLSITANSAALASKLQSSITPNYKDAELTQVVEAVSEVTGKNFVIDARVNAKVTMFSATPMTPPAFYEAFLAILQVYGYVAVPAGDVIKIVPNTDSRQFPARDLPDSISQTSDEIVTHVIAVKNLGAAQLVPLLRPLMPQYGHLAALTTGNLLILTDRSSNVSRIAKIIQRLEDSSDDPIQVLSLRHASAGEVVRLINQMNGAQGAEGAGPSVKIAADERSNSILLGGDKAQRLKMQSLILSLDVPLPDGGDTQVRYLRFADADKIADKLRGQASAASKAGSGGVPPSAGSTANVDASVTIWADTATNALVITAPPKIMLSLMQVIDKLDVRRAQVRVEAIIVEVADNKSSSLGVQWALYGQGDSVPAAVSNLPGSGASIVDLIAAVANGSTDNLTSSSIGTGASLAIGRYNKNSGTNFAAILQALRSDGKSNIISTPSVITMNNEEAEVKVTQDVPLVTGSYSNASTSTNGSSNPFQTIQRQELGTILKVTPHVNEGESVLLKIEQEDSSPGAKLKDSADISTNKRSIKTTVRIEDGGIIVLGGLMSDTVSESEDRIPGVGAIPLLGNLFKSRSGSRQKKNLMVFIRPTILRDDHQTAAVSLDQYDQIRRQQEQTNHGKITLLPGEAQPVLPTPPGPGSGPQN